MTGFVPDHAGAEIRPSPNFGARRGVEQPDAVVLHYTGMPTGQAAEDWLCNPASEVSAHYVVHEDGRIVQLVREADRAWHAGRSLWHGEGDLNSRSVGIEIVNEGHGADLALGTPAFPPEQIAAVIALVSGILERHGIPASRVLAHSDIAPGRKVDPGEMFPWGALAEAGVALHVEAIRPEDGDGVLERGEAGPAVLAFQEALRAAGYGLELSGIFDDRTAAVTAAFQRRHRPARVDGIADRSTQATLQKLLERLG